MVFLASMVSSAELPDNSSELTSASQLHTHLQTRKEMHVSCTARCVSSKKATIYIYTIHIYLYTCPSCTTYGISTLYKTMDAPEDPSSSSEC